jgi:hypothetical protein
MLKTLEYIGPLAGGKDPSEHQLLAADVSRTPFGAVGAGAAPSKLSARQLGVMLCRNVRISERAWLYVVYTLP